MKNQETPIGQVFRENKGRKVITAHNIKSNKPLLIDGLNSRGLLIDSLISSGTLHDQVFKMNNQRQVIRLNNQP